MPIRLAAAALLGLESVGILALAGWQTVALIGGDTDSAVSSIALIVLTVIGAAIVGAFGVATARDVSAGGSGGIVTLMLLALPFRLVGIAVDSVFALLKALGFPFKSDEN